MGISMDRPMEISIDIIHNYLKFMIIPNEVYKMYDHVLPSSFGMLFTLFPKRTPKTYDHVWPFGRQQYTCLWYVFWFLLPMFSFGLRILDFWHVSALGGRFRGRVRIRDVIS